MSSATGNSGERMTGLASAVDVAGIGAGAGGLPGLRMAALGRPQRFGAARRAARSDAQPPTPGLDDPLEPQLRDEGGRGGVAARARGALLGDPPSGAGTGRLAGRVGPG